MFVEPPSRDSLNNARRGGKRPARIRSIWRFGRTNRPGVIIEKSWGDLGRSEDADAEGAQLGRSFAGRQRAMSVGHLWPFTDKNCRHFKRSFGIENTILSFFRQCVTDHFERINDAADHPSLKGKLLCNGIDRDGEHIYLSYIHCIYKISK